MNIASNKYSMAYTAHGLILSSKKGKKNVDKNVSLSRKSNNVTVSTAHSQITTIDFSNF